MVTRINCDAPLKCSEAKMALARILEGTETRDEDVTNLLPAHIMVSEPQAHPGSFHESCCILGANRESLFEHRLSFAQSPPVKVHFCHTASKMAGLGLRVLQQVLKLTSQGGQERYLRRDGRLQVAEVAGGVTSEGGVACLHLLNSRSQ
jgi:hypothetical protein